MEEFDNWNAIAEKLDKALGQIVRKAAFDIQAKAQSNAPIDTGFLKNSIYTITFNSAGTKTVVDKATGEKRKIRSMIRNTKRRVKKSQQDQMLPDPSVSLDDKTAYTVVGAAYGEFVEFGTRFQPARPYFYSAIDAVIPNFEDALGRIEEQLGSGIEGSIGDDSV